MDHAGFILIGKHKGYNLAYSFHKRLAAALEAELTDWVNHPHQRASLSDEDNPIALGKVPAGYPTHDADVLSINLGEDWEHSRCEVWDVNEDPCVLSQL